MREIYMQLGDDGTFDVSPTIAHFGDNEVTELVIRIPAQYKGLATEGLEGTLHLLTPEGTRAPFAVAVVGGLVRFTITRALTVPGMYALSLKLMSGTKVATTSDGFFTARSRVDADGAIIEDTPPSIIESMQSDIADLKSGAQGEVTRVYVDQQDTGTLISAKAYADMGLSAKASTAHTHAGVYDPAGSATAAKSEAIDYADQRVSALGNALNLKGRKDSTGLLPAGSKVGDLWLVGLASADQLAEYVWTAESKWEQLGLASGVDLSNYYTKLEGDGKFSATGHNHDGAYLTTETDPTVPAWAKMPAKPTYGADEIAFADGDTFEDKLVAGELKGEPGEPGYTPIKGVDYDDGAPGTPGKDGTDGISALFGTGDAPSPTGLPDGTLYFKYV